jgi:hypothetical protein
MKIQMNIWLGNLQLWLECCTLPDTHTQPSVNIMNPYVDDDGDWLVGVSTNHEFDLNMYEANRNRAVDGLDIPEVGGCPMF